MQGRAEQKGTEQGRAEQGRAVQSRVGKGKGNAKDNTGHSILQHKAKDRVDYAWGGG